MESAPLLFNMAKDTGSLNCHIKGSIIVFKKGLKIKCHNDDMASGMSLWEYGQKIFKTKALKFTKE